MLADEGLDNVFNPSLLRMGGRRLLTFRHWGPSRRPPFLASLLVVEEDGSLERHDLSAHVSAHGVTNLADPKLLRLGDEAWVAFNDGYSPDRNRIFLMQVTPSPGPPRECVFAGRSPVEKNWAFFIEGGRLKALYSLDPLRILESELPGPDGSALTFEDVAPRAEPAPGQASGLSIGPQAVVRGSDLHLIAHEKWHVGSWRAYVGRSAIIRRDGPTPELVLSPRRLVHSARSMLGSRTKHNRHLLSCTYFSGLAIEDGRALLAYGVNDVDFGFAELPLEML